MAKHAVKGYVTYEQTPYQKAPEIGFSMYPPSPEYSPHKVVVSEMFVEVEVPDDFDPRPGMVKSLEQQKRELRAAFARKVKEIDQQISKLQAIEYEAPAEEVL
jgi:hypothetical protein